MLQNMMKPKEDKYIYVQLSQSTITMIKFLTGAVVVGCLLLLVIIYMEGQRIAIERERPIFLSITPEDAVYLMENKDGQESGESQTQKATPE